MVEVLERVVSGAEEVFEEVRRDMRVEPEETCLTVVDKVGPALFDTRERGTDVGRKDEVTGCGRGEAGLRRE